LKGNMNIWKQTQLGVRWNKITNSCNNERYT
jgi:hypothetical protein